MQKTLENRIHIQCVWHLYKDLNNSAIAELLAQAAENAKEPLQRALRRAARRALLWPEESEDIIKADRSLTEFPGIGPYLSRQIVNWFEHLPDLNEVIPEIRQHFLTLAEAKTMRCTEPERFAGIRGDLQMHTVWSDGSGSIQDMADAAATLGYSYIAITDHSKGLKIAGGINEDQLAQQADEIATVNGRMPGVRVLHSIELNLSPTGSGDMDLPALERLDIVLGCFHSALRRKEDQTERYLNALRNPSIHILGHPRGRIYNFRLGLTADWSRVFALAAHLDKAVEIDCYPDRQDLSIDLLALARKEGCRVSMGTDAHGPSQFRPLGALRQDEPPVSSHLRIQPSAADATRGRLLAISTMDAWLLSQMVREETQQAPHASGSH
jgi:histidinol phosphatase-like PHP family hydrolase